MAIYDSKILSKHIDCMVIEIYTNIITDNSISESSIILEEAGYGNYDVYTDKEYFKVHIRNADGGSKAGGTSNHGPSIKVKISSNELVPIIIPIVKGDNPKFPKSVSNKEEKVIKKNIQQLLNLLRIIVKNY